MDMYVRFKQIRKALGLSQLKFGEKLDLSNSQVACLEGGRRDFTERVINGVCREYLVNRDWFMNGKGEMFTCPEVDAQLMIAISKITTTSNEKIKAIAKQLVELDDVYIDSLEVFVNGLAKK
jgi:transcriptional regulator with XRE-family HTH domain